jgi:hypothetical protein
MSERIIHETTPEESARIDRLAALAEQDRDDILERGRLQEAAAAQPTFVGDVLRAMLEDSPVSVFELAELANVDFVTFDDFRCGRHELPAAAFERVARRLGFSLVRTAEAVEV